MRFFRLAPLAIAWLSACQGPPTPAPAASPTPPPTPVATATPPPAASYRNDVVPMLREHCARCHVPGGPVPDHAYWFDAAGAPKYDTIRGHAVLMVDYVREGRMPLDRPHSVPSPALAALEAWYRANGPDN